MAPRELRRLLPEASPALCRLLEASRGPLEAPIRSEIFGRERFEQHGRSLGDTHRATRRGWRAATFYPRLHSNIAALRAANRYIGAQAATGYDVSPAAEWLLDSFHLVEAQLKQIREGLPRRFFRDLPQLQDPPLAGLPRVYAIAWAFVAHTDGAFDEELLVAFLMAYQQTRSLNLGEMWALPTTLRIVLIEELRRLADRVATNKAAREVANLCCDRILSCSLPQLERLLALWQERGAGRVFLAQMALRLQEYHTTDEADAMAPCLNWLRAALPDLAAAQAQHSADQAADNLSVSNAITSLRTLGDVDWSDIIARSSELMGLMLSSPLFAAEHALTRSQTLHAIERLARHGRRSELMVAKALLEAMRTARNDDERLAEHWLQGPGQTALLSALHLPTRARVWRQQLVRRLTLPAYLGCLLLGTAGLMALLLAHARPAGAWQLLVGALMLFPASQVAVALINRLISESVHPKPLPRLALAQGIPALHRVMVVIPALITDTATNERLAHRLLLHHLANVEAHAQFALLTDWADADTAQLDTDAALLAHLRALVHSLNDLHPAVGTPEGPSHGPSSSECATPANEPPAPPRFIVLHRPRRFSQGEQRWIGWERKRGKLEQLICELAEGATGAFDNLSPSSRPAPGTRFIVTLDSDTQLPPGRLRELVGVAAHPHNLARLDASGRRVVAGYGILQPRVVTPLPAAGERTPFHWMFAGRCGMDPYSAASSDVYQDVFGEGSFSGKGLLDVQALHVVLSQRLPEDRVLSHDLLEGSLARCAAVSDISVIEEAPFHADVAAAREHRWQRGDWQLLPFLLSTRWPLGTLNRWKMFDNLRRSLVAPMSLGLLVLSLAGVGLTPWAATWLVLAAFTAGPLLGAVAGLSPSRDDVAPRHFYSQALAELIRSACAGLWHLALLLHQASQSADAIVRSLYRMLVSRRRLLEWTTAASSQARSQASLRGVLREHTLEPAMGLGLLLGLGVVGTPTPVLSIFWCLVWTASPVAIWWASRPLRARADTAVPPEHRAYLEGIARDTWRLFERCVVADDQHLPPDNLQTLPHDMTAHRTSPTNIGLYLLSAACARQFGWITSNDFAARLESTLATLGALPRHHGHLLNWYDTQTLAPLLPMYVSTVDSGNLCGHLLAVAGACREFAQRAPRDEPPDGAHEAARDRLLTLALRCEQFAWEPDFRFLYHRKRHLFHIGYRVAEQELDASFYDLLASESRLTSLVAIAKGDAPVRHWSALGRPFFAVGATAGLRSWSGSMFEYLMPSLVLDEPPGSALHDACRAALDEQIAFTTPQRLPWGISESAHAERDHTLAYQYAPQGVPRLALRRAPPDELVIAPYATGLAAQIAVRRAIANFDALETLGARGLYGFIEALDFSPRRQTLGSSVTPVGTFMAHHQGMTLVALTNVLQQGAARRWGMAHPRLQAVAPLLHERSPREVSALPAALPRTPMQALQRRPPGLLREVAPGATALEPTHLLSNGRYSITLRANGAGWSRWGQHGITRSRDDGLRDAHGSFIFLRWGESASLASVTQHPAPDASAHYSSVYHADRVRFSASWPTLEVHTTVWVSPEDDIEFRQVELRNLTDEPLALEMISTFEATLADPRADESHPAFSNLFLQAYWRSAHHALVFERTPRLAGEPSLWAAHFLASSDPPVHTVRVQTDRLQWLGRNRSASQPQALFSPPADDANGAPVQPNTGLDPVCAMSVRLELAAQGHAVLTFATTASDNGGVISAVIDKYRQPSHVQRASLMSATLTGIRLRALGVAAEQFAAIQMLSTALVLRITRPRSAADRAEGPAGETCDKRLLWRLGISGQRPIVLVTAGTPQGLGLLRSLAQALRIWSWGGVACDLVVVNGEPASYAMALQPALVSLRERQGAHDGAGALTGFHLLRAEELSADEWSTLNQLARVRLRADGRPLPHHVQEWASAHEQALERRHAVSTAAVTLAPVPVGTVPAPQGAFAAEGDSFSFDTSARLRPTRPWTQVLANEGFGCLITEAGGGYSWARNSRLNQLTAWSNDPVADPPSEWFLVQDIRTHEAWSVSPSAWCDARASYRITHRPGLTIAHHRCEELDITASWCVDAAASVKQVRLQLHNRSARTRGLRLVGLVEWMMGEQRSDRATVHTALFRQRLPHGKLTALLATQHERSAGFGGGTAFLAVATDASPESAHAEDWTCDRRECFDARGRLVLPDHFGGQQGGGLDPCAALGIGLTLAPGARAERVFLLGYADSPGDARELVTRAAALPAQTRVDLSLERWNSLLSATVVSTPDPLFDSLVNHWLIYQTVACRLWAKAGFYQAGGATGFRDQLQDAMALAWAAPALLRQQIVLCASRQFVAGDVQHWWHAPLGAGVRTTVSDDLLWLPMACLRYLHATGDHTLLDEVVPFLEGNAIPAGAQDLYDTPTVSHEAATVFEHAARTLDRSLAVGAHGLPLMGGGDWNDGMNRVGHEGRGESVWLAWFLCSVEPGFATLARQRGEASRAQEWDTAARGWRHALQTEAWDGQWYRRAFFDDGSPLGSHLNPEARIDLIAQAWAVLSGAAPLPRQREAMRSVEALLVDSPAGLIRLLDPPLAQARPHAGYIQAYPPGVRENGGQYSHAGVWALMAYAELAQHGPAHPEDGDTVYRCFTSLSPAHRAQHPRCGAVYGIEPYVMAGDVYTQPPYQGRGGWSWYTGSAAWMHRAAIESIMGLHQGARTLWLRPCLPASWPRAELTLRRDGRLIRFIVIRADNKAALAATADERASLLLPGQPLKWVQLPDHSCFVVPLPPALHRAA